MAVRALTVDDVELYRSTRLESLRADPEAYAATYDGEAALDRSAWRARLDGDGGARGSVFADVSDGRALGIAGIAFTEWDPAPMLVGMWVRPAARGTGVGKRLVEAVLDWAEARKEREVVLWVVSDNATAIALYISCGFVASGKVDTLPSNPCVDEQEMRYAFAR